ncbi:rhodanese-like domain-containing protein [Nocardioides sp. GY 10113]|uniref:rhodanese-like domain-containing protein n=1 Tax=Nocardioides sp. GY 10113 TaxID=2569761 RepID=UPI0010A9132B|nr:rhodanese-like domain-containing protein [Nocardioides sp. GY 10113]TIC88304.1 rhodanese-like domain-containing protein [Nocardioides sp. GY 10113]
MTHAPTPDATPTPVEDVDPTRALALVGEGALLLDVREDDEWAAGHIPGSVHMRLGDLDPAKVPSGVRVVAVCRSGNRSRKAATALAAAGVDVVNLAGGVIAWHGAGLDLVAVPGHGQDG